jgi:hypothetical protein
MDQACRQGTRLDIATGGITAALAGVITTYEAARGWSRNDGGGDCPTVQNHPGGEGLQRPDTAKPRRKPVSVPKLHRQRLAIRRR